MIAWLAKIGSFLAGLLVLGASEEGRRWAARGIALGILMAGMVVVVKQMTDGVKSLTSQAMNEAMGLMGGDTYSSIALEWMYCVTPTSAPAAVTVVFSVLLLAGLVRMTKWLIQVKMG